MKLFRLIKRHIRDKILLKKLSQYNLQDALINEDGTITFIGHVDLSGLGLKKIPFKFKNVHGDFNCSINNLERLTNAPEQVGGTFNCSTNKLTSLKYSPKVISEDFICTQNNLENLEFCLDTIKNIQAEHNKINTLKYFPKIVGGNCYLGGNDLENIDTLKRIEISGDIILHRFVSQKSVDPYKKTYFSNSEIKHKFELDDIREQMNTLDISLSKKEVSASRKVKI